MRDVHECFREEDPSVNQDLPPSQDEVALHRCQDVPTVSVVTPGAPVEKHHVVIGWGQFGVDTDDRVAQVGEDPTLYATASDRCTPSMPAMARCAGVSRWSSPRS